ncbi:hypothetical protein HHK36_032521 [Tetracentron sinense]|uniref:SAM-dependent MTase RsmB/NOP-type domain-containing protein n=1 Tax=Tetracentron sinense TaxID=13715 RepID=A0A835CX52_TETSI|nr:hypothetical protein HHK36_032521 [Tetracentron sinense]
MAPPKRVGTAAAETGRERRMSNAERSSYFARREAAKVLRSVLQGDARRRAVASIKSLVFSPSVRNKKATFALVCQTLKHLSILKDVLEAANVLNSKWKSQKELIFIVTYDILFGQDTVAVGAAEKFILLRKDALQSALAQLLVKKKVKRTEDLLLHYQTPELASHGILGSNEVIMPENWLFITVPIRQQDACQYKYNIAYVPKPRYVRVNTLKLGVEPAIHELGKQNTVKRDDMVPDLLMLPPGTDLHDHPLVKNGSVFLQGKASSMVAVALDPEPGWEVLDACSAPGNKTVHLAALMRGKGKIIACELNKERVKRLEDTIDRSLHVKVLHGDFLNLNTKDPLYSKVRAILLDPSCSGSGTAAERLDHLLPSYTTGHAAADADTGRVNKLAAFQRKALAHALSFPAVERVVYSTCSINQTENEDVVNSVLPFAVSHGFQLETPFPRWPRRGLPVFQGSEHLLRTDPEKDQEGFFIALFVRKSIIGSPEKPPRNNYKTSETLSAGNHLNPRCQNTEETSPLRQKKILNKRSLLLPSHTRMSKMLLYPRITKRRMIKSVHCQCADANCRTN